ncbi:DUF6904 family protein [Pseudomonas aeruginosa]|uniref:DUF6904 family protein n=1 Tax=Pseudomonas aeruginosa TaxID=287 RepID=UPI001BC97452|nr:hypothetical protein [Pseudomonas aeruginosa]
MLEYKLTPHHAGVALWGDFAALDKLHEFIHHVVEESVYIGRYFISLPANQRLKTLPKLMETFNPMYGFLAESDMRPGIIPPSAFVEDGQEWPDFKW